jgi:hypothetical protein
MNSDGSARSTGILTAGFFVLRTVLLPFREFLSWGERLEAPATLDDTAQLEQGLARDRACLRERLSTISKREDVLDALFVASPNIIERYCQVKVEDVVTRFMLHSVALSLATIVIAFPPRSSVIVSGYIFASP